MYEGGFAAPWFDTAPVDKAIRNIVRVGLTYAQEIAEQNTPIDTGHLRESWMISDNLNRAVGFQGTGWEGTWSNSTEYAEYVNYGTGLYGPEHRKYLILPKEPGGTLHWVDRLTGKDMFAKAVMHPGSPGHHMLEISATMLEASWTKLARPVLDAWATEQEKSNPWAVIT